MNLKPFRPGQSGNPGGRPALPPEIRAERKKNQAALIRLVCEFLAMSRKQAKARLKKKDATQLEHSIQGMINLVASGGKDATRAFAYLMEIMAGKLPESDYDGFTEDDLRILERVKEVFAEKQKQLPGDALGSRN